MCLLTSPARRGWTHPAGVEPYVVRRGRTAPNSGGGIALTESASVETGATVPGEPTTELRSWLSAIGALSEAVNAELDLQSMLNLVARTAQDLLELSFCAVMLPDPEQEYLMIEGSSGIPDEYIARINTDRPIRIAAAGIEEAPASRAFRTGFAHTVSNLADHPKTVFGEAALRGGYQSILSVPLVARSGVIGTLNSYRTDPHEFTAQEVEQLELLAEHATIALTSARVLDEVREKHRLIARSEEIHDRLLTVAVRSGGVSGIASALNDFLGCDVVIRDVYGETLASEPAEFVAEGRLADPLPQAGRQLSEAGLVQEAGDHVAADVVLDGKKVATVWLIDRAEKLDSLGVRAVEHASVVLSLELLRQRTAAEVEQSLRGELLADLLGGADPASPAIKDRASLMNHNLAQSQRILVAAALSGRDTDVGRRVILDDVDVAQRAAIEAVRTTSHLRPKPLIASARGYLVALWPEGIDAATGEQVLRRALASANRDARSAVAIAAIDENGIPAAYRVARGALRFAAANGERSTLVDLDQLGVAGLMLQFADPVELRRYADRTLGVVQKYDADHGAELLKTLRAYLQCGLDRRLTGEKLVLHPNTVSQRLRRIETLSGLDLRSPRSVLEARSALLLIDVVEAASDEIT